MHKMPTEEEFLARISGATSATQTTHFLKILWQGKTIMSSANLYGRF
jgi:hypothetical protein